MGRGVYFAFEIPFQHSKVLLNPKLSSSHARGGGGYCPLALLLEAWVFHPADLGWVTSSILKKKPNSITAAFLC